MAMKTRIRVGTLGGPETFAGQATEEMRKLYPELSEPVYFPGGPDMMTALDNGTVDAIVGAEETTSEGFSGFSGRVATPGSRFYVIAEAVLPFSCSLLAKPGTRMQDIRRVYGGPVSIHQGRAFLSEHLPNAEVLVYTEPLSTAQEVADGDGSLAILGTRRLIQLKGLEEVAGNIDGGSYGN
jgi:prephenate dehydratase